MPNLPYQPFYCEENVWQRLAQQSTPGAFALLITNSSQQVALWQQRLVPPGEAVIWDYHVVALTRAAGAVQVWDRDSRLPLPSPLANYLRRTFLPLGAVARELAPRFRLVPAADYLAQFASDRSHMRAADGSWLQPPPPWPPLGQGHTLDRFLDLAQAGPGLVLDLPGLRNWAQSPPAGPDE